MKHKGWNLRIMEGVQTLKEIKGDALGVQEGRSIHDEKCFRSRQSYDPMEHGGQSAKVTKIKLHWGGNNVLGDIRAWILQDIKMI